MVSSDPRVSSPERGTARRIGLVLGLALFGLFFAFDLDPGRPAATRMASVAALMAVWWITEAIPLFATALLPLVLFPLLGIQDGGSTARAYANSTIFLFLGGFMIAVTMERWNLHKRMALFIITSVGGGPSRIVLGFMVASAFLSMWISNTATAVMMTPIALAILLEMESGLGPRRTRPFSLALLLGIAYACSVGGMATLVGTPPNLAFARIYAQTFPEADPIGFGRWMLLGVPAAALLLPVIWLLVTRVLIRIPRDVVVDRDVLRAERAALGPVRFEERVVLAVFAATAVLWVFRVPLEIGPVTVPGWSQLLPFPDLIDDGTVALVAALSLFVIPSRNVPATAVAGPDVVRRLPWHIVLLFGGGFALAGGFEESGLSALLGRQFEGLAEVPPVLLVLSVCLGITLLTEFTSNTATTQTILPILASVAVATGIHPLFLMVPATLSASCAFMMPVATPPNAIVFGSERIHIADMARAGVWINLAGAVLITTLFLTLGRAVLGVEAP